MNGKRFILYTVFAAVLAIAFFFIVRPGGAQWANEPLHSTMEAVEALFVFLMALFLLPRKDEGAEYKLFLPALGFLGMGILNSAHAAAGPGDSFVFLRTAASLIGGLGFALVWLPVRRQILLYRKWAPWTVAAGALSVSALVYLYPGTLPIMVRAGTFSGLAVALNVLAGMLFLAGTWHFMRGLYRSNETDDLLFSLIGAFFGLSGLTFQYSMLWSTEWWFWHVLRLIASLLVLGLLIHRHLKTVKDLEISLSERRRAENTLLQSYNLTKTIIDSMNDAISLIDVRDFTIVGVNNVFLKQYGYSDQSELAGKHCYEITHHRSEVCSPPDDLCPLLETVRTKEHFAVDHVHYDKQGEKIYVEVSTSPIKDEKGNVIQVVHVQRNITDRRRAEQERERLMAELARSNTELEQFAYVASHDLQEPLRMVASYMQLLEKKYKGALDETADLYIHFAVDGARRMQKLIEGLLAYSRIATRGGVFKPVDLNRILDDALSNLSAVIREEKAGITRDDLPMVTGDETQLLQLFQNLVGNALKFRKPGVRPGVHISSKKEGQEWIFLVRDNGIGIEKKDLDQIFQIFHRLHTAEEYPGAGIGLAVCKRIVERHNGRIWLESTLGEGTTFFFTIPTG